MYTLSMGGITFAILAACAFGLWTVFHQLASPHINQVFGAIVVSLTAVLVGMLFLVPKLNGAPLVTDQKGVYFLILAGVTAFAIDFFALHAYSQGLPITIGGPIIIGGSIAVAAAVGFFLGDALTPLKILGLGLLVAGAVILSITS